MKERGDVKVGMGILLHAPRPLSPWSAGGGLPPQQLFDQNQGNTSCLALMLNNAQLANGCRRPAHIGEPLVMPRERMSTHPLQGRIKGGRDFLDTDDPNDVLGRIGIGGELT